MKNIHQNNIVTDQAKFYCELKKRLEKQSLRVHRQSQYSRKMVGKQEVIKYEVSGFRTQLEENRTITDVR